MLGARGEGIIQVGEQEIRVLYTNRALAELEARLGRPILQVFREFQEAGALGFSDLAQMLRAGMVAAKRDAKEPAATTLDQAYAVMDSVGFATVAAVVCEAIAAVLAYEGETEADPNS